MKQIAILSLLLLFFFVSKAQSVPDSGFEVWDTVSGTSYMEPQGWHTSNEQTGPLGVSSVLRTTDAHSGTYAAQIRTVKIGLGTGTPYAGILTNGTIINNGGDFIGGSPFNYLPDSVYFWYKYSAGAFDSALVVALFLHHNGSGRDTSGFAAAYVGGATNYVKAALPVFKHDSIHNSTDSVLLIFVSCRNPSLPDSGQLQVDDVSFGGVYSGIAEVKATEIAVDVSPNPASDMVTVHVTDGRPLINSATIYTMDGKTIMATESKLQTTQLKMNTTTLSPGNYIMSIEMANGTSARKLINITR